MITKTILEHELNVEELRKLELLFRETKRNILDSFLILTDSPKLAKICRNLDIAVAAVLSGEEKDFSKIPYAVTDLNDLDQDYLKKVWQRYRGIPWDICETKRCLVRESAPEDVESFYRIYQDESITAYMEGLFEDVEKERNYIAEYKDKVYAFYGFGMWSVCFKATGEVIGRAGLFMREDFEEPELGYVIGKKWQKQGIATEVCQAILDYGRDELGFGQVQALMHPGNEASRRLCRRLGFRYGGEVEAGGEVYHCYRKIL